jgi:hypothetical protein
MTSSTDTLTPRERLAKIVAEETDGGRRVVRFFVSVTEGEHKEFMPHHRMDAAKELVKIGLEEFEDYIEANASAPVKRARKGKSPAVSDAEASPERQAARSELAQYARELTEGGRKMVRFYSDVMDGLRAEEGFKPHHRIAAAQKLVTIGFGPEAELQSGTEPAPVVQARNAASGRLAPDSPPWTMYHPPLPEQEQTSDVFRELLSPELMESIESDEPVECPCMDDDEYEVCVGKEGGCPSADLEFPEFSEDDERRIRESVRRGLDRRMEIICEQTKGRLPCPAHRTQSEYDP